MNYKAVGERIRCLRENNSYTREVFAEKVGISSKFLYEIEMGKKGFSADTLWKISSALSVSSDYLLTGGGTDNKSMEKVIGTLEGFDPRQIGYVREMLRIVQNMWTDK